MRRWPRSMAGGLLIGAVLFGCGSNESDESNASNEAGARVDVPDGRINAPDDAEADSGARGIPMPVGAAGLDGGMILIQDYPDAPNVIAFHPSKVSATRPTQCGQPLTFMSTDWFIMNIEGTNSPTQKTVPNNFTIDLKNSKPAVGVAEMLTPAPFSPGTTGVNPGQNASAPDGTVDFNYDQCGDPNEIDPGAFDAVTITVVAMPAKDGDPLTIDLQVHFVDGKTLADTFSAPLVQQSSGCP